MALHLGFWPLWSLLSIALTDRRGGKRLGTLGHRWDAERHQLGPQAIRGDLLGCARQWGRGGVWLRHRILLQDEFQRPPGHGGFLFMAT